MTKISTKLSTLRLVYPPISNYDAYSLQQNPQAIANFKRSDFYMIASRAEILIEKIRVDIKKLILFFSLSIPGISVPGSIDLEQYLQLQTDDLITINIKLENKRLVFSKTTKLNQSEEIFAAVTPDQLLFDIWRKQTGIQGFKKYRKLTDYKLHYIGIAKTGDTFSRLIKNGHKARMDILSNEQQIVPGANVSNETFLFLFHVDPIFFTTFNPGHNFTNSDFDEKEKIKSIVADAEKAFINLMKPKYNKILFQNYPKGQDGLYNSLLDKYCYVIGEGISFNTQHGKIKGSYGTHGLAENADTILVDGDTIKIFRFK